MHAYTCVNELTSHLKRIIITRVNERSKQCDNIVDFIRRLQCSLQKKDNMHDHLYTP